MSSPVRAIELGHGGGPLRLAQITDTHLGQQPGTCLLGMDTDQSLLAVLDALRDRHPDCQMILATGDLSDHGSAPSYQRLASYLEDFGLPVFTLPGNHDLRENLAAACGDCLQLVSLVRAGEWQIVMLDSQVLGEVGGELGAEQLALLDAALRVGEREGLYSLVCLHHQPVATGSAWLDEQMVSDAEDLLNLLGRYSGVRGLLWGHVHQTLDEQRGHLRLMSTPSTCVQFAPGSDNFRAERTAPGYRWLELHPDGRIDSEVVRVPGPEASVDLESGGYS